MSFSPAYNSDVDYEEEESHSFDNVKFDGLYGFDRLVEDLIQESMSKGEFTNLSGVGKPLRNLQNRNPYVDFVTHKLNEVLIDNGFTPEWILLQKEIKEDAQNLRNELSSERSYFGAYPLSDEDKLLWDETMSKYEELTKKVNNKIDKFNLVVPVINKQMVHVCLKKEAQKVLVLGKNYEQTGHDRKKERAKSDPNVINANFSKNLFSFIENFFKK